MVELGGVRQSFSAPPTTGLVQLDVSEDEGQGVRGQLLVRVMTQQLQVLVGQAEAGQDAACTLRGVLALEVPSTRAGRGVQCWGAAPHLHDAPWRVGVGLLLLLVVLRWSKQLAGRLVLGPVQTSLMTGLVVRG